MFQEDTRNNFKKVVVKQSSHRNYGTLILRRLQMNGLEVLVPITFFVLIGAMVYHAITSRHKERMTMLEKGFSAEQMKSLAHREFRGHSPLSSLKWGIIILAIGLAIIVGNFLRSVYQVDESIVAGVVFLFAGLALVAFYIIASKKLQEQETHREE